MISDDADSIFQTKDVYGGSFSYHLGDAGVPLVAMGFVVRPVTAVTLLFVLLTTN